MWRQQQRCTLCAMTETPPPSDGATGATSTAQPPPPPRAAAPAPLYRPREGRVFRGVCAAIGRATGTDPVLWRVLVVVFLFFGGAGLVLYLAGWLFLPDEGEPPTELQRLFRGQGASTGGAIGLAVLVIIAALVVFDDGRGLLPLIVVAALAYLVLRDRQSAEGRAPVHPARQPACHPPAGRRPRRGRRRRARPRVAGARRPWGPPPPPPPPVPPRPRSPLGLLTVSAAVLVVGALLLAGASAPTASPPHACSPRRCW
jgi:phage shock protein PspC (stress-responsive transcriptional regulator)